MDRSEAYSWQDRCFAKELTNQIIDIYFREGESWIRAILRMCIFSLCYLDGQAALLVECPNQAIAKRLSLKICPLLEFAEYFTLYPAYPRVLLCYPDRVGLWYCYDSRTKGWVLWRHLVTSIHPQDD